MKNSKVKIKKETRSGGLTKLLPIGISLLIITGCAHYKVIEADKAVRRLKAQQAFTAPGDGWFVPDARWVQIREAIADKVEGLEKAK